ncbi:TlpA disulfide reductase family protein [Pseudokordiimonas caeni]|uniref:TlpA disulfide reductase family protein n=1 Tax=Pseudokordiimonas caeni TaxID=2997908 RepID=UPI0028120E5E|nr:TlpA disulfide reductase family protein [Pseudokordiimonas caeni]
MRILFSVLFALVWLAGAPASAKKPLEVGDVPPDMVGYDQDGNELLLSNYKGQVVIVTFWATWCPPCLQELPVLEGMQRQVPEGQLKVIAVNFKQRRQTYARAVKYMEDYELTFSYDKGDKAVRAYGVKSLPHMFMITKEGRIGRIHLGYGEGLIPKLVDEVNELLRWKPIEMPQTE